MNLQESFRSALDSLWLWRYPHESYDYDRFWTRAIRYLGESRLTGAQQQVALGTRKQVYAPGEPVVIELQVLDPALMLQLKNERVSVQVTAPGDEKFYVALTPDASGMPVYRGGYAPRRVGTMELHAAQAAPALGNPARVRTQSAANCSFFIFFVKKRFVHRRSQSMRAVRHQAHMSLTTVSIWQV